jgi:trk system potassium uptake protein TrkH
LFILGVFFFTLTGLDFKSSLGVSAASLGNVGPAIGDFGPSFNYSSLPQLGKYLASFLMIFGRLELFTVFVIFTPYFWKNR